MFVHMHRGKKYRVCRGCGQEFLNPGDFRYFCSLECGIWSRILVGSPDECWPWTGPRNDRGYGRIRCRPFIEKETYAHRLAYESRREPLGELFACHRCDNPICCNPAHIFPGTLQDNCDDMMRKGRHRTNAPCGSRHYKAKLTDDQVRSIRKAKASGTKQADLARTFNITPSAVAMICSRKRYGGVI